MNLIKVVIINFLVLVFLLLLCELGLRAYSDVKSCIYGDCTYKKIKNLTIGSAYGNYVGFSKFDSNFGYVPMENFHGIVNAEGWKNVRVTIDENGFRANDNQTINNLKPINVLAIGDSFTFGDQVSNNETWPSCLERNINAKVLNAGVFGYGAAQALKRGEYLLSKNRYQVIIFSVLVNDDFERDRLKYRNGFPRPSVIKDNEEIKWDLIEIPPESGTKFNIKNRYGKLYRMIYENSYMVFMIGNAFGLEPLQSNLTLENKKSPDRKEVIEWVLQRFNSLEIEKKFLLLQYGSNINDPDLLKERELIIKISKDLKYSILDTYNFLEKLNTSEVWNNHHTPYGNEIICKILASKFK